MTSLSDPFSKSELEEVQRWALPDISEGDQSFTWIIDQSTGKKAYPKTFECWDHGNQTTGTRRRTSQSGTHST